MERLKHIKESLIAQIQAQMGHLERVDTEELGDAIDMIKDLEEAIYYCTITEAMNKKDEEESHYFNPYEQSRMYYNGGNNNSNSNSNSGRGNSNSGNQSNGGRRSYFGENYEYPVELRDFREGRSPKTRRMYMESKEMRHDKSVQIQELEQYMKELSSDIVEMIQGASPEEKQLLKSKLTTLVSKIDHA